MRHGLLLALACAALALATTNARANVETVTARIVYVSFPDDPPGSPANHGLVTWEGELATEMPVFTNFVSNQGYNLQIQTLRRPDDPTKAWVADHPSTYYRGDFWHQIRPDFGDLNDELVVKIWNAYGGATGNIWAGVNVLIVFNYNNVFPTLLGIAWLNNHIDLSPYGFSAVGATMVLLPADMSAAATTNRVKSITEHEYGHLLFNSLATTLQLAEGGHTPGTGNSLGAGASCGNPPTHPTWVNYGHYDGLTGPGANPGPPEDGFIAYHPMYLSARGWVPKTTVYPITGAPTTVRVSPIRQLGGSVVEVAVPGSNQSFLLVNHQNTGYDAIYGGSGLLVWHIFPGSAWDLESAVGKTVNPSGGGGTPDPNTWWDPLEAQVCHRGSINDFFLNGQPGQKTSFTPTTNPNTNLYSCAYDQGQANPSGLSFTNMRYDPGTLDILVDVSYSPVPPAVPSPVPGTVVTASETVALRWTLAGATADILVSDASGANFTTIANDIPNTGRFDYVVPATLAAGTGYRLRVEVNNVPATGLNSVPFQVWGITNLTAQVAELKCDLGISRVRIHATWNTSQSGGLNYNVLVVWRNGGGTPMYVQSTTTGTAHSADIWADCSTGTWTYQVLAGVTTTLTTPCGLQQAFSNAITTIRSLNVPTCLSCGGGCRPPCEFD